MNRTKVAKNAGWLVGIQVLKSIIGLAISMLTARFLGPSNFGLINYAASIVSFIAPVMYLGLNGILVQELTLSPEKEGEILGTSFLLSFLSALACIGGVVSFTAIANQGETETILVCALYSILLIFQCFDMMTYWFQAKLLSKYSSILTLLAHILISAYKIFLLATEKSVYWFAVSYAIEYMLISFGLFIAYKKLGGKRLSFSFQTAKKLLSKSRYYIVANMMVSIFAQTDRIMLKLMVNDAATGFYSAAVTCAGMTGFVFSAIIDSFRPMIFEDKNRDRERYEKDVSMLYSIIIYLSLLQSIVFSLSSGLIVNLLYGEDFAPAASVLRLLVWYTTFSYLGSIRNIWMLAEDKQKCLWIINLSGALANVILNYFLIPVMGAMGAALASLITQIFTNVIIGFIIKPIRYNNKLMLRSLDIRNCIIAIKKFLSKRKRA